VMTGVPVTTTAFTFTNPTTARFNPPASTVRDASGTVAVNGSLADTEAEVAVSQALGGGPSVQVVAKPVDALTGAFTFTLPTGAPQRTAYAAGATALTFSNDSGAAGKYILMAEAPGHAAKTATLDISAAAPPPTAFTFP
jgi:hypothetical protein